MENNYSSDLLSDSTLNDNTGASVDRNMNQNSGPSEFVIQKILGYSKALRIQKSSALGDIEQIIN
jgi:hypothetical protein